MSFQDIKYVQGCKYYRQSTIIAKGNEDVKLYTTGRIRGKGETNNTLSDE